MVVALKFDLGNSRYKHDLTHANISFGSTYVELVFGRIQRQLYQSWNLRSNNNAFNMIVSVVYIVETYFGVYKY